MTPILSDSAMVCPRCLDPARKSRQGQEECVHAVHDDVGHAAHQGAASLEPTAMPATESSSTVGMAELAQQLSGLAIDTACPEKGLDSNTEQEPAAKAADARAELLPVVVEVSRTACRDPAKHNTDIARPS
jgi:hypothetical protein